MRSRLELSTREQLPSNSADNNTPSTRRPRVVGDRSDRARRASGVWRSKGAANGPLLVAQQITRREEVMEARPQSRRDETQHGESQGLGIGDVIRREPVAQHADGLGGNDEIADVRHEERRGTKNSTHA